MPSVRATPDELENGSFTLKTRIKCFPFTLRRRIEFKNTTITVHFRFVFAEEKLSQGNHRIIAAPSFSKSLRFSNGFSPTRKCKGGSFKSLRFEESFRKAPFSSKMLSVHITLKRKAGAFEFLRFEERFRKFRFRDRLVWTVGLTVEIKLRL